MSGVDLDMALSKPEFYDPQNGYCVRVAFAQVVGVDERVRICSEWLDFSDPSGNTHRIREGAGLAMGADGQLHYETRREEDYRLMALVLYVFAVIGSGMWAKRYLISRYQLQLVEPNRHA